MKDDYSSFNGYAHLAAGLSVGLCGLAAGYAIGIAGDAGVRAAARQQSVLRGLLILMIFSEALALYGTIIAILLIGKSGPDC